MNLIYKLFRQDPESREGIIAATSLLGITVNVLIALLKVIVGALASSIAIVSEGLNNASDALSSILTLLGAKLAKRHPDDKHPFGYGRIEYLAGLIIAGLILVTGAELLISSVRAIFTPEEMTISYLSIAIVAVSAVIKFILGTYTIRMGKKAHSDSLTGVGAECRSDSFASVITIVSAALYIFFHVNIDGYAGVLISALILKAGYEVLRPTVADLIGRPGEEELAASLYREIRHTDGILGAADMMLHNYGPDRWSGSVNVEVDQGKTVGEAYEFLHRLQLRIMHEYNVVMVFGIYAVDNEHPDILELRKQIAAFIRGHEHIKSYHAVYIDSSTQTIYCDFIVDHQLRDWDEVRESFLSYMNERYPGQKIELTVETEFV